MKNIFCFSGYGLILLLSSFKHKPAQHQYSNRKWGKKIKSPAHNVPLVLVINRKADSNGVMPCYRIRAQNPAHCTWGCTLLSATKQKRFTFSLKYSDRPFPGHSFPFFFYSVKGEGEGKAGEVALTCLEAESFIRGWTSDTKVSKWFCDLFKARPWILLQDLRHTANVIILSSL